MDRDIKQIKKIIVHCSDSEFGNVDLIDQWHRERGFASCGYHYVILNGFIRKNAPYDPKLDGLVEFGRPLHEIGAHVKGHNTDSIGICLIGKHLFSGKQLLEALPDLITNLCVGFKFTFKNIFCHRDFDPGKTCPNIDSRLIKALAGVKRIIPEVWKEKQP
jgi:N-acetyl-anhydromuramyl-L-alanine amidase AmpD